MCDLTGKFALVTGGAQGIGLAIVREFLVNNVQGVTLIDFDAEKGKESTKLLNEEFGEGKVIFLKVDVSNKTQLEDAFKDSIKQWKYLDIVVNNAGVMAEIEWEPTLAVNCGGVVQGNFLGFKYMSTMQAGRGGIIINMASMAGIAPFPTLPVYSATKGFVVNLSRSFGSQVYYEPNGVKVLCICPGSTTTTIIARSKGILLTNLCPKIKEIQDKHLEVYTPQTTEEFAKNLIKVIKNGKNGSVWYLADNEAKEVNFEATDKQVPEVPVDALQQ